MNGISVTLREVEDADIELFYEFQLDPEATAMAAFPARERDAHFAHWEKVRALEGAITMTIQYGDSVAGNIGSWIQDDHREVGYWIGKEFWGRGIATRALQTFVQMIGMRPLYAWVAKHNTGSIRVLEKAGFRYERTDDDYLVYVLQADPS